MFKFVETIYNYLVLMTIHIQLSFNLKWYENQNILPILLSERILYPHTLFHYDYNNFQCKLSRFLATHFIDFDICWHSPHSFLFQWKSINACLREYHAFVPSLKICQRYLKYFNFVNKKTVHISKISTFISLASS